MHKQLFDLVTYIYSHFEITSSQLKHKFQHWHTFCEWVVLILTGFNICVNSVADASHFWISLPFASYWLLHLSMAKR